MLRRVAWALALLPLCLATPVSVNSQDNTVDYYCGRQTYGLPLIADCSPLLESFADYTDTVPRVFDEEQMRADPKGSWPGVIGIVAPAHLDRAVQVPRYYSSSTYDRLKDAIIAGSWVRCADKAWIARIVQLRNHELYSRIQLCQSSRRDKLGESQ